MPTAYEGSAGKAHLGMKILWIKAAAFVPPDAWEENPQLQHPSRAFPLSYGHVLLILWSAHPRCALRIGKILCIFHSSKVATLPQHGGRLHAYMTSLFSREPYNIKKYCRPEVRRQLTAVLEQENHDLILCYS